MHSFLLAGLLFLLIAQQLSAREEAAVADSLEVKGQLEEALRIRKQLVRQSPGEVNHYAQLLLTRYLIGSREGKADEAVKWLQEGIRLLKGSKRDFSGNTILIRLYGHLYHYQADHGREMRAVLATALEVYELPGIEHSEIPVYAQLCSDLAGMYAIEGNQAATIRLYEEAIAVFAKSGQSSPAAIGLCYNNLAYAYDVIGYTHQVLKNYEQAHGIWFRYCPTHIRFNNIVLQNLITTYLSYGDVRAAKKYLEIYKDYFARYVNPEQYPVERLYQNDSVLHAAYDFLKANIEMSLAYDRPDSAGIFLDKMKGLYRQMPAAYREDYVPYVFSCIESLAFKYKSKKAFREAEAVLHTLQPYIKTLFSRMKYHASLGVLYYDQKSFEKSLAEVDLALKTFPEQTTSLSFYMLTVLKAELLMELNKVDQSMASLGTLYRRMLTITDKAWTLDALTYRDFNGLNTSRHINILLKSARIYELLYRKTQQSEHIRQAFDFYDIAAEMFNRYYLKGFYNRELDQLAKTIKEGLLSASALLKSSEAERKRVLNLIENNESQHLWKKFLDRNAVALDLPDGWLEEQQLSTIEEAFLSTFDGKDEAQLLSTPEKVNAGLSPGKTLQKHTSYARFSATDFDVDKLRPLLRENEMLIKYVVGQEHVFAWVIDAGKIRLMKLAGTDSLRGMVHRYYRELVTISGDHVVTGRILYQQLVKPLGISEDIHLVFVVEDFLQLLPMEAVLDAGKYFSALSVNYAYSLKMLELQSGIRKQAGIRGIAVFAPEYKRQTSGSSDQRQQGFKRLFFAQKEASAIIRSTKGTLYSGDNATKDNFVKAASEFSVLHLAMHAIMDTGNYEYSYLAFQHDQPLYFHELYKMDIPARLVILSACNTGNGLLENGEGFMSLSRAFAYAGVPAAIHSLWEVPDKETAALMELFYRLLNEGKEPAVALTLAKKAFREKFPLKAHPYFWAGFVINGYTQPVPGTSIRNREIIAGIAAISVLLILSCWWFRRNPLKCLQ